VGVHYTALLGSDKAVVVDARDHFIKGDRYLEPLEVDAWPDAALINASVPATGGPPAGEYPFRLNWDTSELVTQYLTFRDPARVSSLVAVLRDARAAMGRSEETGVLQPGQEARAGNWLGALGYMVMIEHIGKIFRPRNAAAQAQRGFRGALANFAPHLKAEERNALYALRCCFAHDYSLVNRPDGRRELWHRFDLYADEQTPLVDLPPEPWNGLLRSPQSRTKVNLRKFGDLAEEVFSVVVQKAQRGELEIIPSGGVNDLRLRYTLFIGPQSG
jgi:hypothetical protein